MLKKYLILILFLCIGCNNQDKINTLIYENQNILVSINYPNTEYKKLNYILKKDVDDIYNNFLRDSKYNDELNIDYKYTEFESYISIYLIAEINNSKSIIKTYFFDTNQQIFLNITDILDNTDKIIDILLAKDINIHYIYNYINKINFYIDNEKTYIFFNNEKIIFDNNELIFKDKLIVKNIKINQNRKVFSNKLFDLDKKYVAITFDDGPSKYTKQIIDILKKHNVNATFFVLGNKVKLYSDILNESIDNGNVIGNHSYNHKLLIKLNKEDIINQINKTNEEIKFYTGYTPTLFRPTYGSVNSTIKNNTNMDIVLWNVDTMDWKYRNINKIVKRATKSLKDGDIILMHDIYKSSAAALEKIIIEIKKQGFEIVTIPELKEIKKLRNYE